MEEIYFKKQVIRSVKDVWFEPQLKTLPLSQLYYGLTCGQRDNGAQTGVALEDSEKASTTKHTSKVKVT